MNLPKGWVSSTIGQAFEINPRHPSDTDRHQSVSFVPMSSVDEATGKIASSSDRTLSDVWSGYTHFSDGDVIFAKITPCMENGKAAVVSGMTNSLACGSTEFYVLRSKGAANPEYLWRYLRQTSFRDEARKHMSGAVGQQRVPKRYLEGHSLPLPPIAEQRRIVSKVATLANSIGNARRELAEVPLLAKKLRDQALADAYTAAAGESELRPISYFLSKLDQGWSPKCENFPSTSSDQWAVLKTTAVQPFRYLEHENKLLPQTLCPRRELEVAAGDILITRAGPRVRVGISCLVEGTRPKLILADKMYRLRAHPDRAVPKFLVMALNAPQLLKRIEPMKTGISDSGLNLTQEKFLSLPVPSVDIARQTELAARIQSVFDRAQRLEAEAARAGVLLDRLEAAILSKAFRGELVPQNANDEPADMLIEHLRTQRLSTDKPKRARRAARG